MPLDEAVVYAILRVAAAGAVGGLIGGWFGGRGRNLIGALLMGVIGGITAAAIARILSIDPWIDAGESFSYAYSLGGGLLLALVVAGSSSR